MLGREVLREWDNECCGIPWFTGCVVNMASVQVGRVDAALQYYMAFRNGKLGIYRLWIMVYESHANRWQELSSNSIQLSDSPVIMWATDATDATNSAILAVEEYNT